MPRGTARQGSCTFNVQNTLSFIMCLIFVMIMNVICCVISNAVLLHNNVSYNPFEYYVTGTTCRHNVKITWINSLSGTSGLH